MAGRRKGYDGNFAVIETGFILNDPRLDDLTPTARWLYLTLWCLAVKDRRETLSNHYYPLSQCCLEAYQQGITCPSHPDQPCYNTRSIAHQARIDWRSVPAAITKMIQKCMIRVSPIGEITVCGIRDKHPNFRWKESPINGFIDSISAPNKNKNKKKKNNKKKNNNNNSVFSSKNGFPYQEIIDDLNLKAQTKYKSTSDATRELIRARIEEGFTEQDFFVVHSNMVGAWLHDPKMSQYLRPSTLYRKSKFEGYLNRKDLSQSGTSKLSPAGQETAKNLKSWMEKKKKELENETS